MAIPLSKMYVRIRRVDEEGDDSSPCVRIPCDSLDQPIGDMRQKIADHYGLPDPSLVRIFFAGKEVRRPNDRCCCRLIYCVRREITCLSVRSSVAILIPEREGEERGAGGRRQTISFHVILFPEPACQCLQAGVSGKSIKSISPNACFILIVFAFHSSAPPSAAIAVHDFSLWN